MDALLALTVLHSGINCTINVTGKSYMKCLYLQCNKM